MFLWVRLILYTLEGLYYDSDVKEAIKTLPEGLDALYASFTETSVHELTVTQLRKDTITYLR